MALLVWTAADKTECGRFAIQKERPLNEGTYYELWLLRDDVRAAHRRLGSPPLGAYTHDKRTMKRLAQRIADEADQT